MKFLFFSPHTLADSCSGAAKCVQTLFEELNRLGHPCRVLTGAVVDGDSDLFRRVLAASPARHLAVTNAGLTFPLRTLNVQGVEHQILGAIAKSGEALLAVEEVALKELFLQQWAEFAPDVLLTYGGFTSSYVAGQYALAHGKKSVLFAATDSYGPTAYLSHVSHIATVSAALAARLRNITEKPVKSLSAFVQRADVTSANRTPEFITFVNPIPSKGLKLATALALACQEQGRAYKFLFVEGRGTKATALAACPELAQCRNISFAHNISDMRAVYGRTALVLYPSLCFEGAGRVAVEANANGIPVLAHNIGGVAEMLDGAGYLFNLPQELSENWSAQVPANCLAKWLDAMDLLLSDPAEMADAARRAKEADTRYSLTRLAERFVDGLKN
jgi:hypothetical protein